MMQEAAMRTTLEIRDDVLEKVKAYAAARSISDGSAATELLERGLNAEVPTKRENGILILAPGPAGAVTAEQVMNIKDELEGQPW
jgi:hypothetical protein